MASEWVGVIGTGIGAGIGGVVTVVSLWFKGNQEASARREAAEREDRLRMEDRTWSLRQQNSEDRRALYARLVAAALAFVRTSRAFLLTDDPDREIAFDGLESTLHFRAREYGAVVGEIYLVALDWTVIDAARKIADAFDHLLLDLTSMYWGEHVSEIRAECDSLDEDLIPSLRDACRRDLGLDANCPDETAG